MIESILKLLHQGIIKLLFKTPLDGDLASKLFLYKLSGKDPIMIARFGSTEIKAVLYPFFPLLLRMIFKKRIFSNMETLSGFFAINDDNIRRFSKLMIEDMKLSLTAT